MKAIRVHAPGGLEVLRLEDVPDPRPGPGEIVVRLEAIGVNFIEIYQRTGAYPIQYPYTPGREGAGSVSAVGSGVTDFRVGDRVASEQFTGAYAQIATARADKVVRLPDAVDSRVGAAVMLQ